MATRADPLRIDRAREAAVTQRLIGQGMTRETAETWITRWQDEAWARGLERGSAYWEAAWEWIVMERGNPRRGEAGQPMTQRLSGTRRALGGALHEPDQQDP